MSRRGRSSRKGRRSFQTRVKRVIMKTAETKYYDIGIENVELYHNAGTREVLFPGFIISIPQFFNPWNTIVKGTNRFDRIGDKITPRGMSIKLWLGNKSDRPNLQYRVIVALLPKQVGGLITAPRFDPFQIANSGSVGNNLLLPADSDKGVKFLYDRTHSPKTGWGWQGGTANSREFNKTIKLWIKRKKAGDIVFQTLTQEIVNKPIAVYVIPYEQYSTLNTDNIASVAGFMRMYYKDV